jgi:hypothetical protein
MKSTGISDLGCRSAVLRCIGQRNSHVPEPRILQLEGAKTCLTAVSTPLLEK